MALKQAPNIMNTVVAESNPPKRNWFKEIITTLVGLGIIVVIIWFLVMMYKENNRSDSSMDILKTPRGTSNIRIYPYSKNGITYLVFQSGNTISVLNYTTDSLRLQEYLDYQQMVKDTVDN